MEQQASQEQKQPKKAKRPKKKSKGLTLLKVLVVTCILGIFAVAGAGCGILVAVIKSTPDVSKLELKPTTDYTSFVYDQNGQEMDRLSSGENRIYVALDEIPLHLQQAVIAIEDERFYEHNGIDIRGILRAIVVNLKSGEFTEGASTITQQLIKNNILTSDKKIVRKLQEQYMAIQYEKIYAEAYGEKGGKDLILEYYLNTMPLGRGTKGVQAASHRYFNKDVSDLTLAEGVVLACITQAPTRYDPISNPENNYEKSQRILTKMVEQGYITEEEKQAATDENPYKNIYETNKEMSKDTKHSYFVDAVIDQVVEDLQTKKGITAVEANKLLFGGGVQIYTTFDPKMQQTVDKYISDDSLYPTRDYEIKLAYSVTVNKQDGKKANLYAEGIVKSEEEIEAFKKAKFEDWGLTEVDVVEAEHLSKMPQPQSAFVIMDQATGHVKALSGGRGDKEGDRTFNRATQAKRQPGSIFKVLAAYAPALDMGLMAPGTLLDDSPVNISLPSGIYSPRNWDNTYRGNVSVRQAIWHSINSVTVKTLQQVGVENAYNYLLKFGFTTLTESDQVYAMALGGLTEGITPFELNAAMAAIANGGIYNEPILYTKIVDRDGNLLLQNEPESHRVVSEATASMLINMMEDVIKKGTGGSLRNSFSGMPVAGKTGTTNNDKDFLFSGFTPYYTGTIWLGHDDPKRVKATGREHLKIWGSIMDEIHEELPYKNFKMVTTGYVRGSLCAASGMAPTELCRLDANNHIVSDYFLRGELTGEPCNRHVQAKICTVSGKIANEFCPKEVVKTKAIIRRGREEAICDVHTQEKPPVEPEAPTPGEPVDPENPQPPKPEPPKPEPPKPEPPKPEQPKPEPPKPEPPKPEIPDGEVPGGGGATPSKQ